MLNKGDRRDHGYFYPTPQDGYDMIEFCMSIPDNPEYRRAFWGHLFELAKWTNWHKTRIPGDTGASQAAQYWLGILLENVQRFELMTGCESGIETMFDVRQNPENTCELEKTTDGETWVPWADLRLCVPNIIIIGGKPYYVDPITGEPVPLPTEPPAPDPREEANDDDKKCAAAANAAEVFYAVHVETVNMVNNGGTAWNIVAAIAAILVGIIALVLALPALVIYGAAILAIQGGFALSDFSEQVREQLTCILYCAASVGAGGVVTFDYDQIVERLGQQIVSDPTNATMWLLLQYYTAIMGEDGVNLAGATTSITEYDCSNCDCDPGYVVTRLNGCNNSSLVSNGTYNDPGDWYHLGPIPASTAQVLDVAFNNVLFPLVTEVRVSCELKPATRNVGISRLRVYDGTTLLGEHEYDNYPSGAVIGLTTTFPIANPSDMSAIHAELTVWGRGGGDSYAEIREIRVTGLGDEPIPECIPD